MTIGILKLSIAASTSTLLLATAAPAETKDVTVTLPVNFCLANWPFYVAAESRLFADEGLEVSMQGMDGSSAAIQAVLAGQAQIAVTAPADMLAAKGAGADVIGFYSFYQKLPFRLITPAESEIKSLAHLEGKTIGISNPGGGDAIFMRSLMNHASLGEGDYEEMAVGEGNMAASAFTGGVVDAYSASFVEEIIFSGMEVPYVALESEGYPATTGELLMVQQGYLDENPDVIEGIGRALARATKLGLGDRDLVVATCGKVAPHETEDPEFAGAVLDGVDPLFTLVDAAKGQYGYIDETVWGAYRDLMVASGISGEAASKAMVSNAFVSAWNKD